MIIRLPSINWFYQLQENKMVTNTYTGSLGTDPCKGFINKEIFIYKIQVIGKIDSPELKAECAIQLSNKSGIKSFEQLEKTFEATAEGLTALNEWLDGKYLKYKQLYNS